MKCPYSAAMHIAKCKEAERTRGKLLSLCMIDICIELFGDGNGLVPRLKQIAHKDILLIVISFIGNN